MTQSQRIRTQVTIHGQNYTITGTDSAEHVMKVAALVDSKMKEISSINPNLDTSRLAVLTAVNAVHDLVKLQERYDRMEQELQRLKD
ncbi:cell division protein ZapA [Bacillus sp. FJAT-50079]|uniref:cell division protein ZapA n=1 Tax=Bacillus sp. FJAT-50079 TaxID=2833577 RepID=UPI001BC8F0B9|nr:cell division protein ZapA [Bacillus sp. FJAT-50079]MBS4208823.1 cell division protein ZapA [Bacillus sp. FJAT-50079]